LSDQILLAKQALKFPKSQALKPSTKRERERESWIYQYTLGFSKSSDLSF